MATLVALTERAAREAGIDPAVRPLAAHAALCLAGADLPADVRMLGGRRGDDEARRHGGRAQ